ncbi:ribonuclease H-like domain-containing protein [Fodinibius saliphilus]|uniref:ribonuclease H-like domain-containing protein n=1 Tax=Fodinibius saliphilus TaxID=1920650 RepID=UPI0011087691|nr:ribonuclease H-like domain-containing protein [Fodinibius saliphilus]
MFFVFDVETIPDFEFVRNVIEDPEKDDDDLLIQASEKLARNSSGFLPPMYHHMISWVGLWIENNGAPKKKVGWHGTDEKEGLIKLFDALSTYKDFGLVHHNGRGFDLPLLTYRALKHGLQMPKRLNHYDIKYRYSNDNVDLLDEFSNYGASSWPKLKHLGYLIDIPFKQTGEGNEVLKMFREDKLAEIEHYCYEDVMATYVVWLHLKYTVGDISKELFDNLNERAMSKLNEIQSDE